MKILEQSRHFAIVIVESTDLPGPSTAMDQLNMAEAITEQGYRPLMQIQGTNSLWLCERMLSAADPGRKG